MVDRLHMKRALHMVMMGAHAARKIESDEASEGGAVQESRRNMIPMRMEEHAQEVADQYKSWTTSKGFQGMGLAKKRSGGEEQSELALKVYVEEKLPGKKCGDAKIDKYVEIEIDGTRERIPTDVEPIGKLRLEINRNPIRPAPAGASIFRAKGHPEFGTLGCLVRKVSDPAGPVYILSNSHVLADQGLGQVGDAIVQPGTLHGGKAPRNTIATLFQWGVLNFVNSGFFSTIDAAIAKVKSDSDVLARIQQIGLPAGSSNVVQVGMNVEKYGAASQFSTAVVRDTHFTTGNLRYRRRTSTGSVTTGNVRFTDQVLCTQFTSPGDSGSAVVNSNNNKIVGLHFAGSPAASVFNKISNVLSRFEVEVVTQPLS